MWYCTMYCTLTPKPSFLGRVMGRKIDLWTWEGAKYANESVMPIKSVLRIWEVYPGSEFFPFRIPGQKDSGSRIPDPYPHQRIEVFLTQKIVCKLSEIWSGMFIPDPVYGSWFLPIPDPGYRGQKGTGSGSAIPHKCNFWSWKRSRVLLLTPSRDSFIFHDGFDSHKESILWNRCLGSIKVLKFGFWCVVHY